MSMPNFKRNIVVYSFKDSSRVQLQAQWRNSFYAKMDDMKYINVEAYEYLVQRNPNTWCIAFFNLDIKCAALENVNLEDQITPTVRKRLEYLKQEQRHWIVHPSGYEELEVRCRDHAYGVNLSLRKCVCRLWQLSGVPRIHAVARTNNQPPLTLIVRKMPGRPRKKRVKATSKNNSQVTRLGKQIRCFNCQGVGHNKASGENPLIPKPITIIKKVPGRRREPTVQNASARGGGKGSRGEGRGAVGAESRGRGAMGADSGGRGAMDAESRGRGALGADSGGRGAMGYGRGAMDFGRGAMGVEPRGRGAMGSGIGGRGTDSGGKETMYGDRGRRGGLRGRRCGERGFTSGLKQAMKEEMMYERMDLEREREEQEWQAIMDPLNEFRFSEQEESMDVEMYNRTKASINFMVNTQESVTHGQPLIFEPAIMEKASVQPTQSLPAFTEGPSVQPAQAVNIQPANDNASKKRGKRTKSELEVPFRIYHKNIGRSERIRNMQEKKFKFDAQGTRSTAEKTFDVSP
nr:hypothetical protein [Tanacetum cinerariifolium]